jgi:hypothetical protein
MMVRSAARSVVVTSVIRNRPRFKSQQAKLVFWQFRNTLPV